MLWTFDTFWSSLKANVSCVRGLDPWILYGEILGELRSNASSGALPCASRDRVLAFSAIGVVEPTCVIGPTCDLTKGASPKWPLTRGVELTSLLLLGN